MMFRETAHAKINLALHVRNRRADGYHELETLFAFAEDGDGLSVGPASQIGLTISGPFAAGLSVGEDNLVIRAGRALAETFGVGQGAALHLEKNLPIASGIGGGSADAAAALRLLVRFWGLDLADSRVMNVAAALGADIPACVASRSVIGTGVGDILSPYEGPSFEGQHLLLVNPLQACPTGLVFSGWDQVDRGALDLEKWGESRNDLAPSAIALVPEIADVLERLNAISGARLVRMSGSGATCFALYDTGHEAEAARREISCAHSDWWVLDSRLR
jgi:4-diphosphocytidyl-2-C-methyl-D-erythritol kinase